MTSEKQREIIEVITDNCISYLVDELGIKVVSKKIYLQDVSSINLDYLSSIITLEGHITSKFAFTYEKSLIDALFKILTADIAIDPGEEDIYLEETACEIINIVIGNATAKLEKPQSLLRITPPFVIKEAKHLINKKDSKFFHSIITTEQGHLNLYMVLEQKEEESK
jgi:CheY-specific phosphatase CheX